jgi:hypothetical protein
MLQSPWSGLQPRTFDPTPLPIVAGTGLRGPGNDVMRPPAISPGDGVTPQWWGPMTNNPGLMGGRWIGFPGANGGILSIVQSLMGMLQQLLAALMNGNGSTSAGNPSSGYDPDQAFKDVDISSTGDPHIAETGTAWGPNGTTNVDKRYDSMTSHDDLVDSRDVADGYRVSTTVTQPGANGVTYNQSASVHTDRDSDQITMNKDGSFSITDHGGTVGLIKGQTVMLSGSETVTENQDGSLTVNAANERGGSISTTLRATGNGVDVTTHGHNVRLGGDAVKHAG